MNATLQAHSLKRTSFRAPRPVGTAHSTADFKKILQCIAKFGEELQIQATHSQVRHAPLSFPFTFRMTSRWAYKALPLGREQLQIRVLPLYTGCRDLFPPVRVDGSRGRARGRHQVQVVRQGESASISLRAFGRTDAEQSVMSVLGRGNQQQSVDTLQLQIVDAEGVAPTTRRRPGKRGRGHGQRDEEQDDGARASIQAKLILVLNCKHGTSFLFLA